jgi:hypothetical protein
MAIPAGLSDVVTAATLLILFAVGLVVIAERYL